MTTDEQDRTDSLAVALMEAWKKAEPESDVAKYPTSYIATFVDLARVAIAEQAGAKQPAQFADNLDDLIADLCKDPLFAASYQAERERIGTLAANGELKLVVQDWPAPSLSNVRRLYINDAIRRSYVAGYRDGAGS